MKKTLFALLCASLLLAGGLSAARAAEEVAIRISACNSLDHPQTLGLQIMKEYVESKTGGRVVVHIFPNSQLAAEVESLEQVQMGTLEMATASIGPVVTFQQKFAVLDIPFLFEDYPLAWAVLDSPIGTKLFDSLEEVGMYGLGWYENGYRHATNNIRPIKTVDDFKGLKIRTMQAPLHMTNFRALGANPTPVPWSELYMSLAQKIVDGQENPIANIWDIKLVEVQKYTSLTGHIYDAMPLVTNLNWFRSLKPEYQSIIETGAILGQNYSRFINYDREELIISKLREQGMEINAVTPEAKEAIRAVSLPAVAAEVKSLLGEQEVNDFLAGIDKVRADIKKSVE